MTGRLLGATVLTYGPDVRQGPEAEAAFPADGRQATMRISGEPQHGSGFGSGFGSAGHTGGHMIVVIVVVLAAAIGGCLIALRRRGGSGERGAVERGAADQGLAKGLGTGNAQRQNMGPF